MSIQAPPPRKPSKRVSRPTESGAWLLTYGIRLTVQKFSDAWTQLPREAWRVWVRTMIVGWLLSAVIMLGLVWAARASIGDETALFFQMVQLSPLSFHAALWAETPGNSIFLVPVMLGAATLAIWWNAPLRALAIVAAFVVIDTLVLLGWLVWDRARPSLIANGIASPGFHSFPSGHVAQTITVYGLLVYFWFAATQRGSERMFGLLVCLVLILTVGFARLSLGTHWPSDLVAGAIIGTVWLAVIIVALRQAEARL